MKTLRLISFIIALSVSPIVIAEECGTVDEPCRTSLGEYYVALPDNPSPGPTPVLMHFHGAGGDGPATISNRERFAPFLEDGWIVIAPQGQGRRGSKYLGWNLYVPNSGRNRDEVAFTREVLEDAAERFGIDREFAVASGYSVGGTAVWNIGCRAPELFFAFAPIAGGFWRPHPKDCAGPVRLLHTHGWLDQTVPLEGRPIRNNRQQGDIFDGLQIWREANGCDNPQARSVKVEGQYWSRVWDKCAEGSSLVMLLHKGGHEVPDWWATHILRSVRVLQDGGT